ncbi:MAG: XrtA/PEP-CTERM system histidine kinase PrsK [Duganella sp.]
MAAPWPALLPPQSVSVVTHGVAALAFLALAACAAYAAWAARTESRRRVAAGAPHFPGFALAALVTAMWALGAAAAGAVDPRLVLLIDGPEVLRTAAWLQLLIHLNSAGARRRRWTAALWLLAALQLVAMVAPWAGVAMATALRLVLAVAGLLLVEQVYRAAPESARWGIKLACLGMGALFAYDFYLYADALLFRRVQDEIWAARGIVNTLSAPLVAVALLRNPAWDSRLQLSRQMMFRSVALLGAGGYLMAMAASAWYLRSVGGRWGPVMQVACLCGAALLLAALLFSGAARARLKVFVGQHFYRGRYDYRAEWQRFTQGLGEHDGVLAERTIEALAGLVESPAGVLWLSCDAAWYRPAAAWNTTLPVGREAQDGALSHLMNERHWVIEADAWRRRLGGYAQLPMPPWCADATSVWLVAPLLLEGRLYGFVSLAPPRTPVRVDWEVRDVLRIAGRQAATMLAHRASAASLAVARQFESFNRLSAFVAHDLKNLVSQLALLLANAERHKDNPRFQDDMAATLHHSLAKMQQLLLRLGREDAPEAAAPLALERVLQRALDGCRAMAPQPVLTLEEDHVTVLAHPQRLERVLGHLVLNAVEATPGDGNVAVRLRCEQEAAVIEVQDSGCGMTAQFVRERLFQPFDTTKPAGMGIGVFESRQYLQELGGRLDVESLPRVGTTFRITLPLAPSAALKQEQ